jgi:hypothetical protein
MNKIPALLAALAVACGSVYANTGTHDKSAMNDKSTTAAAPEHKEGLGTKTKRAFHRMGDKLRSMTHRDTQTARSDDTRTMGAAGSGTQDSARQKRMDDAYNNWKSKQAK